MICLHFFVVNHFLTGIHIQVDTGWEYSSKTGSIFQRSDKIQCFDLPTSLEKPTRHGKSTVWEKLKSSISTENCAISCDSIILLATAEIPGRLFIRKSSPISHTFMAINKSTQYAHPFPNQKKNMYVCIHIQYIHIILTYIYIYIYLYIHTLFSYT